MGTHPYLPKANCTLKNGSVRRTVMTLTTIYHRSITNCGFVTHPRGHWGIRVTSSTPILCLGDFVLSVEADALRLFETSSGEPLWEAPIGAMKCVSKDTCDNPETVIHAYLENATIFLHTSGNRTVFAAGGTPSPSPPKCNGQVIVNCDVDPPSCICGPPPPDMDGCCNMGCGNGRELCATGYGRA